MPIHYIDGDATKPIGEGNIIIAHVCNDVGGWGRGFVLSISRKWKTPEAEYRAWFRGQRPKDGKFGLSNVQFVQVESHIWIANMVAQRGVGKSSSPRISLKALESTLAKTSAKALELDASIHMPKIGTGEAGGNWNQIEPVIRDRITPCLNVFVYNYKALS